MPGKHITHQQEAIYMKNRQIGHGQETAAEKAGISIRSGRRIEKVVRVEKSQRQWRTRQDPFALVWETELVPLLYLEPELTGTTLWEYLDDRYPGQYPEKLLRSLQRRVKHWRASKVPGRLSFSASRCLPGTRGCPILPGRARQLRSRVSHLITCCISFAWHIVIGVLFISSGAGKVIVRWPMVCRPPCINSAARPRNIAPTA